VTKTDNLEEDIDRLFKLPLAEFTAARNTLAKRLKTAGRADDAERVKSLAKPPLLAWTVNQLYWRHRETFDALIAAGKQLRSAHALQLTNKPADTRGPSAARREALASLLHLADLLLREAGHSPTPETMRRITTTLEALSAAEPITGMPAGRLTQDVSPPGFESFAGLVPEVGDVKSRLCIRPGSTTLMRVVRPDRMRAVVCGIRSRETSIADSQPMPPARNSIGPNELQGGGDGMDYKDNQIERALCQRPPNAATGEMGIRQAHVDIGVECGNSYDYVQRCNDSASPTRSDGGIPGRTRRGKESPAIVVIHEIFGLN
jgi:hypothetical protein